MFTLITITHFLVYYCCSKTALAGVRPNVKIDGTTQEPNLDRKEGECELAQFYFVA